MMNAELDENGILTISPTTPTEAYAIKKWAVESAMIIDSEHLDESMYIRGSKIVVIGNV